LDAAALIFASDKYEPWPPNEPLPESVLHTFPRFHLKGVHFSFFLVPSEDYLIDCDEDKCEKSLMNIPYPKLEVLAQSLLDTQRFCDLEDLIDGMDLSEEWGEQNLDLDRSCNVEYAQKKNEKIRASIPKTFYSELMEMNDGPTELRGVWQEIVRSKAKRIGVEMPRELYNTRFYAKGREDPRKRNRYVV
jgi:hypothetical protein